jgi:hypothetical protein
MAHAGGTQRARAVSAGVVMREARVAATLKSVRTKARKRASWRRCYMSAGRARALPGRRARIQERRRICGQAARARLRCPPAVRLLAVLPARHTSSPHWLYFTPKGVLCRLSRLNYAVFVVLNLSVLGVPQRAITSTAQLACKPTPLSRPPSRRQRSAHRMRRELPARGARALRGALGRHAVQHAQRAKPGQHAAAVPAGRPPARRGPASPVSPEQQPLGFPGAQL